MSAAADGVEMRRALEKTAVDLVSLDLNLPREEGLTHCRDLGINAAPPIIMLTARRKLSTVFINSRGGENTSDVGSPITGIRGVTYHSGDEG